LYSVSAVGLTPRGTQVRNPKLSAQWFREAAERNDVMQAALNQIQTHVLLHCWRRDLDLEAGTRTRTGCSEFSDCCCSNFDERSFPDTDFASRICGGDEGDSALTRWRGNSVNDTLVLA
jgi:hypothetical protein